MALLGLAAGLFQIIFLREFLVIAEGNELSLGLCLGAWLFWSSLGSLCLSRQGAVSFLKKHAPLFLLAAGCAGVFSYVLLLYLGYSSPLAGQGSLNIVQLGFICLFSLALVGFFCGGGFVALLSSGKIKSESSEDQASLISRFYGLEALGAALAGVFFTFALVHYFIPPVQVFLACLAFFLSASILARGRTQKACLALCGLLGLGMVHAQDLKSLLPGAEPVRGELLAQIESPYARLTAIRDSGQIDFFASRAWLFSYPDDYQEQNTALLGVLANPKAKKALFIGPDAHILAARALKHFNYTQVAALSMDSWLGEMTAILAKQKSQKIKRLFADPRQYLRAHKGEFDLILLSSGAPSSFQNNRFYTEEGFRDLAGALGRKGVVVTSLPGVEHLLGVIQAKRLAGVLEAAGKYFQQIQLFSGPELRLILTNQKKPNLNNPELWVRRYKKMNWQGVYAWQPARIRHELSAEKLDFIATRLKRIEPVIPNQDLRPRALLFDPALWGAQLGQASFGALGLSRLRPWQVWGVVLLLNFAAWGLGFFPGLQKKIRPRPEVLGIWVVGFSAMALNLFLIMSHQVLIGAVYQGLALLTGAFMLGTCLACFWLTPLLLAREKYFSSLRFMHLGLQAVLVSLGVVCLEADKWQAGWALKGILWLTAVLSGGFTGAYFGLAGHAGLKKRVSLQLTGGRLYGWDLAGALGGALAPMILVPTVGLFSGLIVLGLLNALALGVFWRKAA